MAQAVDAVEDHCYLLDIFAEQVGKADARHGLVLVTNKELRDRDITTDRQPCADILGRLLPE